FASPAATPQNRSKCAPTCGLERAPCRKPGATFFLRISRTEASKRFAGMKERKTAVLEPCDRDPSRCNGPLPYVFASSLGRRRLRIGQGRREPLRHGSDGTFHALPRPDEPQLTKGINHVASVHPVCSRGHVIDLRLRLDSGAADADDAADAIFKGRGNTTAVHERPERMHPAGAAKGFTSVRSRCHWNDIYQMRRCSIVLDCSRLRCQCQGQPGC